jgi:hypothetical protein
MRQLEVWSEQHLGQWHYVLGYIIVLTSHNWPIFLALTASLFFAVKLYRNPTRTWACWLFTALMFGLAYEYEKHIAGQFHQAVDFLFGMEIAWLNPTLHFVVGPLMNAVLLGLWLLLLAEACRQSYLTFARSPGLPFRFGGRRKRKQAVRDDIV